MKPELETKLKEKYPNLYADMHNPDVTPRQSCMVFGIETGDGWFDTIDQLSSKLEPLIVKYINEAKAKKERDPYFEPPKAVQIKEKFGGLRFYMNYGTDEMYNIIDEAEDASYNICETCGKPGKSMNSGSWIYAMCEECWNAMQQRRYPAGAEVAPLQGN